MQSRFLSLAALRNWAQGTRHFVAQILYDMTDVSHIKYGQTLFPSLFCIESYATWLQHHSTTVFGVRMIDTNCVSRVVI